LGSLQKLGKLQAECSRDISTITIAAKEVLTSVNRIMIDGMSSILTSCTYPNAQYLTITNLRDPDVWRTVYAPGIFSSGAWSNLICLEIGSQETKWCEIYLPSVKKIVVGERSRYEKAITNSFVKDLASQPDMFPALHHIGLRFVPEWDLLFILLESRNFSANSKASPITTISLPSFPSFDIVYPLVNRLKKKLTRRPSNFELSLLSIADIYFAEDQ
jgi:hypothetical protein